MKWKISWQLSSLLLEKEEAMKKYITSEYDMIMISKTMEAEK